MSNRRFEQGYEDEESQRRTGCWAGVFVLVVGCVGGVIVVLMALAGEPNDIRAQLQPDRAVIGVGEALAVEVTVENVSLDPVTISSIGIEQSLLDGIELERIDPPYRSVDNRSYPLVGKWSEYLIQQSVQDGNTIVITLMMRGINPGVYSGDVMVWIDSDVLGILPMARARREPLHVEVR